MRTEARVAFDATAIYVAVHAFDSEPDRIMGFLTRRDAESSSDWVHVLIDSYHDRRTAYQFGVNPVGVKQDRTGSTIRTTTTAGMPSGTWSSRRDKDGWCAEFRIPFSQLRFSRGGDGALGLRGDAKRRPPERDHHVAAPVKERERVRLVVRRLEWRDDRARVEAARARSVRRRRNRHDAAGRRKPTAKQSGPRYVGWCGHQVRGHARR